jgi:hypothetical protein
MLPFLVDGHLVIVKRFLVVTILCKRATAVTGVGHSTGELVIVVVRVWVLLVLV